MVKVVEERHGGMVNKFLGDGFLALFGVGRTLAAHADAALEAGCEMLRSLAQLNEELELDGERALAIGIGIHTGPAIVGSIGSPERLEYTAIGSTVNFAAKIERLTKVLKTPLLLSESTRAHLRSGLRFKQFPPQPVRGLDEPATVFSLAESREGSDIH